VDILRTVVLVASVAGVTQLLERAVEGAAILVLDGVEQARHVFLQERGGGLGALGVALRHYLHDLIEFPRLQLGLFPVAVAAGDAGTEPFPELDPPTGEGVIFDSVVVLLADATGFFLDLTVPGGPQFLAPGAIQIDGGTIRVTLSETMLVSRGFAFEDYGYNLWPRFAPGGVNPADNTQVSDFAPDASTFKARVPEPAAIGLLGLGLLGLGLRRRAATSAI
jgi:hypothetical protein